MNLRKQAEADLADSLEDADQGFGLPVELIGPGAEKISANGQVLKTRVGINPETGEEIIVEKPVVVLRRSSLSKVPKAGENWAVKIPSTPDPESAKENYVLDSAQVPSGGASVGFVRLYLRKANQI